MSKTLDLAMELLAQPSVTPNDSDCQAIIAKRLEALGFRITHYPQGNVSNLWATQHHPGPVLCFAGHTDVVPPGPLEAWESPPFSPTLREGKLYARGAADMKSSIAAMVTACERFIAKNPTPSGSIAFLITSDEEGPAIDGTQAVLRRLKLDNAIPDWCLVGEASSTEKLGDVIKIGRRGSLSGALTIEGTQGHIAYPQLADNPIHAAFSALGEIAALPWDQATADFPATHLQFSYIQSGNPAANNVIPGSLTAHFNLRFSPFIAPETIQHTVGSVLQKHNCRYRLTWTLGGKPFLTPKDSPFVQAVVNTVQAVMGYSPECSTSGGTSDGRFFAEYGCAVVELGPNNATIHKVNECIDVVELEQLSLLYEQILYTTLTSHHT